MIIEIFLDYDPYNYDDEIVNKTSLICATAEENKELINLLLQYGADVNAKDSEG